MPRQIAFLRAINVGGRTVKMEHLREMFAGLGFQDVETFIASGNVGFATRARGGAPLERKIETMLRRELGYDVATFVRSPSELAAIVAHEPFPATALATAGALNVAFLKEPLDRTQRAHLKRLATDIDAFHTHGREIWWLCARKQSESKFSNALLEKALQLQATFRGMKTLQRMAARYAEARA